MSFIFFGAIASVAIYFFLNQETRINSIKRNGIKVIGTVIQNAETQGSRFQLGGNINDPTIKFITAEGREIVGKPVVGFVSHHEIIVPMQVYIIYNSKKPQQFYLDLG